MHVRGIVCALATFAVLTAAVARAEETPLRPVAVAVQAKPIDAFEPRDPSRRQFGALEFRGGLVLTSAMKEFGGLSGIRMDADGAHFLAMSDKARWFRGRIVYRNGRPIGLADVESAPMLGPDGRPLARRGWYDSEALGGDGGTVYVGIERVHQIVRFDYGRHGIMARGQPIAVPPAMKSLPSNKGIEGLIVVPSGRPLAGTLIAFSERGLDPAGNIKGFLIGGRSPGAFTVKRSDDYDVSDVALVPGGDILVLERRFSWTKGVAIRIRRVALASVRPDAVLDGAVLLEADMGFEIDNMEGLGVHRSATGDIVLTLVSDDNFSPLQRTLLLQFGLAPE